MKLLEYQAKALMEKFGVPTMKGAVVSVPEEAAAKIADAGLTYPVVVKAQEIGRAHV
jgi:succinyl-CoA synthetase beta subunit